MQYYDSVLELIGRTPLVRLRRLVDESSMARVLVKMEHLNPAGSNKDRMALNMIRRAEEQGLLKPGATIIESTSGNTGLGLAMVSAVRGYRTIFTMPDKMSQEKIDMLKAYGAEVIITPTDLDHDHPDSYCGVAKRLHKEISGSFYTDQYSNQANPEAHYLTTGPEIWEATDGQIDALVGGIGTGGTISGAGKFLRERVAESGRPLRISCPDPHGSIYKDLKETGTLIDPSIYRVEGIGHDFMVDTLDFDVIDDVFNVSDRDSFVTARRLAREEGIFCGGSSGTAVFGALQVARELGPGKLVVCMLADSGDRYLSKVYNDDWMKDMGYVGLGDRLGTVREVLKDRHGQVEFAESDETLADVARRMTEHGISQMPVLAQNGGALRIVHEADLLHSLVDGDLAATDPVDKLAKPLRGVVGMDDPLSHVQRIFDEDNVAIVVDNDMVRGVISRIDVVEFLASRT